MGMLEAPWLQMGNVPSNSDEEETTFGQWKWFRQVKLVMKCQPNMLVIDLAGSSLSNAAYKCSTSQENVAQVHDPL